MVSNRKLLRVTLCGAWLFSVAVQQAPAGGFFGRGCGCDCTQPYYFWKQKPGPAGHNHTCDVPWGTECSCPPRGPFFGYYPTSWSRFPGGWQNCPVQDWEANQGMPLHRGTADNEIVMPGAPIPTPADGYESHPPLPPGSIEQGPSLERIVPPTRAPGGAAPSQNSAPEALNQGSQAPRRMQYQSPPSLQADIRMPHLAPIPTSALIRTAATSPVADTRPPAGQMNLGPREMSPPQFTAIVASSPNTASGHTIERPQRVIEARLTPQVPVRQVVTEAQGARRVPVAISPNSKPRPMSRSSAPSEIRMSASAASPAQRESVARREAAGRQARSVAREAPRAVSVPALAQSQVVAAQKPAARASSARGPARLQSVLAGPAPALRVAKPAASHAAGSSLAGRGTKSPKAEPEAAAAPALETAVNQYGADDPVEAPVVLTASKLPPRSRLSLPAVTVEAEKTLKGAKSVQTLAERTRVEGNPLRDWSEAEESLEPLETDIQAVAAEPETEESEAPISLSTSSENPLRSPSAE